MTGLLLLLVPVRLVPLLLDPVRAFPAVAWLVAPRHLVIGLPVLGLPAGSALAAAVLTVSATSLLVAGPSGAAPARWAALARTGGSIHVAGPAPLPSLSRLASGAAAIHRAGRPAPAPVAVHLLAVHLLAVVQAVHVPSVARIGLADVTLTPDTNALPGGQVLQNLMNGIGGWALALALLGLIIGAAAWAIGSHGQNYQQSYVGRRAVLVSGLAALIIGAGPAIVNFFFHAGQGVH